MAGSEDDLFKSIQNRLEQYEESALGPGAARTRDALRRNKEKIAETGYRQAYALDADRILHSRAYTRYIDKTQVFYLIQNDHITHRVLHVQLVSKIARTIGRFLSLNEDLVEAVALGHDIGHPPFGHDGESFLSEVCLGHGIGHFLHNVQSIQFLDRVERQGHGWNLSIQTLDGILCHDGEVHNRELAPGPHKTFEQLDALQEEKKRDPGLSLTPMTREGCVVRMADTISYIGRDIEDAIRLSLIRREELPKECTGVLGNTNGSIVHTLVTDIIENSMGKGHVGFSSEKSEALKKLKKFNMENIYLNPMVKRHTGRLKELFSLLFETCLGDLEKGRENAPIFKRFLRDKNAAYTCSHKNAEIVRDFIAGMTDRFFLEQFPENQRPEPVNKP